MTRYQIQKKFRAVIHTSQLNICPFNILDFYSSFILGNECIRVCQSQLHWIYFSNAPKYFHARENISRCPAVDHDNSWCIIATLGDGVHLLFLLIDVTHHSRWFQCFIITGRSRVFSFIMICPVFYLIVLHHVPLLSAFEASHIALLWSVYCLSFPAYCCKLAVHSVRANFPWWSVR